MRRAGLSLDYPYPCQIQYIYAFRFPAILCILLQFGLAHDFLLTLSTFHSLSCYLAFFSFARFFSCLRVGNSSVATDKLGKEPNYSRHSKFNNGGRKECPHTCCLSTWTKVYHCCSDYRWLERCRFPAAPPCCPRQCRYVLGNVSRTAVLYIC